MKRIFITIITVENALHLLIYRQNFRNMNATKAKLVIEFNVSDLPTLTEIFKKFKVKTKPERPSADEIEQLIIKKALRDAKAIDKGTLETKSFNTIADLMSDLKSNVEDDIFAHAQFQP